MRGEDENESNETGEGMARREMDRETKRLFAVQIFFPLFRLILDTGRGVTNAESLCSNIVAAKPASCKWRMQPNKHSRSTFLVIEREHNSIFARTMAGYKYPRIVSASSGIFSGRPPGERKQGTTDTHTHTATRKNGGANKHTRDSRL